MSDDTYTPPRVWKWDKENGGAFASINRPIAGSTHDKDLPVGKHPLQLYSLATPNGVKVTVMLEELLEKGKEVFIMKRLEELAMLVMELVRHRMEQLLTFDTVTVNIMVIHLIQQH